MIKIGDAIPATKIFLATPKGPTPLMTADYFAAGRSVLFGVPGAFTPTCSARHLPSFLEERAALANKGVERVACLSVNDGFVMQAWAEATGASGKIDMLADGNGDFVGALGLDADASAFGMGRRSQRFAMIINDGKVSNLFVDAPGAYEVSSASHVLNNL